MLSADIKVRVKVTPVETLFREPLTAEQTSKHRSHAYLFTGTYKCGEHHHDHNKALLIAQRRNNQNVLKKKKRERERERSCKIGLFSSI